MKKSKIVNTIKTEMVNVQRKERSAMEKSCAAVGLQLLNFCANGSPAESVKPPIESGYLRGSGSVFVNGKFISATPPVNGLGNPLGSFSVGIRPNEKEITVIYNTEYAGRWHENPFVPGGMIPSKAARNNPAITKNVGYKWVEKHLIADRDDLLWLFRQRMMKYFFKGSGK